MLRDDCCQSARVCLLRAIASYPTLAPQFELRCCGLNRDSKSNLIVCLIDSGLALIGVHPVSVKSAALDHALADFGLEEVEGCEVVHGSSIRIA